MSIDIAQRATMAADEAYEIVFRATGSEEWANRAWEDAYARAYLQLSAKTAA